MATRRYSTSVGDHDTDVIEAVGAATVSGNIELTVNIATTIVSNADGSTRGATREEVLLGLERIARHIESGIWLPA